MANYKWLWIMCIIAFWGCSDTDVMNPSKEEESAVVYFTTPSMTSAELATRGNFPTVGDPNTDQVSSLYVLLFDAEDNLINSFASTLGTAGKATVLLKGYTNVHVRLLANVTPATEWVGTSWTNIQSQALYALNLSGTSVYPMTADVGVMSITNATKIGTAESPIQLIRSFAQVFVNNASTSTFTLSGFRLFNIREKGFVFPQTTLANASNILQNEAEAVYTNGRTVSYVPETKLQGVTKGTETFLVLYGLYNNVPGYYRIDFKKTDLNGTTLLDLKRNNKYIVNLKAMKYGYATAEEAIKYPLNDEVVEIDIEELPAYAQDIDVDTDGHYFAWTNSTVYIYGKDKYHKKGFEGTPEPYSYVLTIAESQDAALTDADLEFIDNPVNATWVKLQEGTKNRYALVADATKLSDTESVIKVRYKDIVKEIKVTQYADDYIDCTYGTLKIGAKGGTEKYAAAYIEPYIDATGKQINDINWSGLAQYASINQVENCDESSALSQRMDVVAANNTLVLQYRENLDPLKMGVEAKNYDYEGYRFMNVFATDVQGKGRVKTIVAQPNADLVGFFGGDKLVNTINPDEGKDYTSYLAVQRKTPIALNSAFALDAASICDAMNPKGKRIWYMPSSRQLKGLWISDNSKSRQTSTFKTPNLNSGVYRYVARKDYTNAMQSDYNRASLWGDNNSSYDLSNVLYYPKLNFTNGETTRSYSNGNSGVRCVRNIANASLPASVKDKSKNPISGTTITMDPSGYLTDDYFGELNSTIINPVSRKIELSGIDETVNIVEYYWDNNAGDKYIEHRTGNGSWINPYKYYYLWTSPISGFLRNDSNYFAKFMGDREPEWGYGNKINPYNQETVFPVKSVDKEVTLQAAYDACKNSGKRLPTARELELLYIYHPLLPANLKMYFEVADGYAEVAGNPLTPNKYYYKMLRYGGADSEPYLFWYWSSTTRSGNFNGNDNGSIIPHRINFVLGDVNARGAVETGALDMYRCVKSVK
ncbi:hypothetical protein [Bacteroides sp.]|uniref:hypothetical protein n=1 Tax=Bacteroides sp. TaxID=29523 RepID=UPI00258994EF|nr:hypothetical protein [Bacteroides sp.]